jgi:hypothetical protein
VAPPQPRISAEVFIVGLASSQPSSPSHSALCATSTANESQRSGDGRRGARELLLDAGLTRSRRRRPGRCQGTSRRRCWRRSSRRKCHRSTTCLRQLRSRRRPRPLHRCTHEWLATGSAAREADAGAARAAAMCRGMSRGRGGARGGLRTPVSGAPADGERSGWTWRATAQRSR